MTTPSDPQSTTRAGRQRTHPLTVLFGLGGVGFGLALGTALEGADVLALVVGLGGALRLVGWFFRTYELRDDDMVISGGVFTRREQVVPYDRVQQIDFHRGLVAQLFGLTELRIDTAGSQAGRVSLAYLDHSVAESIRTWVLAHRDATREPGSASDRGSGWDAAAVHDADGAPQLVYALSPSRLLLAGATTSAPVLLLALYCIGVMLVAPLALGGRDAALRVVVTLWLGGAIVVAVAAASALGHLLTYARLRLSKHGEDLQVDYGLFEVQHLTVPRRRVQHVTIADNPLRRALGIVSLTVRSAAAGGGQNATNFTIVALPRAHVAELLAFVLPSAPLMPFPRVRERPPSAARRAVLRRSLLLAVPAGLVAAIWFPVGVASLPAIGLGIAWGRVAHRRAGHIVTETVAIFSAGAVAHQTHIVPIMRVQSARTRSSPLQRRAGLATLSLDVAGAAPGLYDMHAPTAAELRGEVPLGR